MKIQTLSIVAGSEACNARCPFCISKMTVPNGIELKEPQINTRNFAIACRLAKASGCTTAMITGKGEPTLFPHMIWHYTDLMKNWIGSPFPLVELQTNGIPIQQKWDTKCGWGTMQEYCRKWYENGMTTVAISVVHYNPERNREIYVPHAKEYIDLPELIQRLHSIGFSVRLRCIMLKGYIDTPEEVQKMIGFAKLHKVEQLTFSPVNKPDYDRSRNPEAFEWTENHQVFELWKIRNWLNDNGSFLLKLMHGGVVYDVAGQNVCYMECLTKNPDDDNIRQLIYFPDGHIRYDWQYEGAIVL